MKELVAEKLDFYLNLCWVLKQCCLRTDHHLNSDPYDVYMYVFRVSLVEAKPITF